MESPTDRQERISWWRQSVLQEAQIAVIGAGALGNEVVKNLALMGIGHLHIFDRDRIELTNLSRSVLFDSSVEGQPKALVAAERARQMSVNRLAVVEGYDLDVVWELGGNFLSRMSVVLGCLDNVEARMAVGQHCYRSGVAYIDGGIAELNGRVQLHLTDIGACMDCTLTGVERKQARARYSCGQVMKDAYEAGAVPTVQICSAFIATLMCQEAIKHLHGKKVRWGHVISWFGETNDFDTLQLQKRANCETCSAAPPPRIDLTCDATASMQSLLDALEPNSSVLLPAQFIEIVVCRKCGESKILGRPYWKCYEKDLECISCGTQQDAEVRGPYSISLASPLSLREKTLEELGIPKSGTVIATTPSGVVLAALAG